MLSPPPGIQVFMAVDPVDMQKTFDGLSAAVQAVFGCGALDGHLFLFLKRCREGRGSEQSRDWPRASTVSERLRIAQFGANRRQFSPFAILDRV